MTSYLSERSTAYVKMALELWIDSLGIIADIEGDDPTLARAKDEMLIAISELGTFNNRMQVHYEGLRKLMRKP